MAVVRVPPPKSWFPGHMAKFTRILPAMLKKTNVVLEIRDARLPLTSINRTLEGAMRQWRLERGWDPNNPGRRFFSVEACEHIVVLNKRDLVPEWGLEPFRKAMEAKFPYQKLLLTCWKKARDVRNLMDILVSIGRQYPHAMELNVLVLGMPNVGKSTLLNMLRHEGIKGPQAKAFRTSANPGLTQSLSTRLKISEDPVVYAYDSPGIMVPFLGIGEEGAERGVRLALIAGIKEGLYNSEDMAAYLLDRLNIIDPISPAYMPLLPPGSSPTSDVEEFLGGVAKRMGLIKRGEMDLSRAAVYFVGWWRNQGGDGTDQRLPTSKIQSWGFDFQWNLSPEEQKGGRDHASIVQDKMEQIIGDYVIRTDRELVDENNISQTQLKKKTMLEEKERRRTKYAAKRAAR